LTSKTHRSFQQF